MRILTFAAVLGIAACSSAQRPIALLGGPTRFDLTDADAFRIHGGEVELVAEADYAPPYRSPRAIALLDGTEYRSFTLDLEMMQTGREYGHRDLCLFFGFESAERFYYVHLATTPDERAHNVFLVDGAARRNLIPAREKGVDWGQEEWHHVRIVRDVDAGAVRVFFDDMQSPVLEAEDRAIEWGRVGFGSFDDTGRFKDPVLSNYESRPSDPWGSPFDAD